MFQGTGSDVGKSLIVAGLCRAFALRGCRVRPFKPQNMSNNAAVTLDGGEIGRAQALQARACFVAPSIHMNPVLLKPQSETGAQVVVQGRVFATAKAAEYAGLKPLLLPRVLESFEYLRAEADIILVEGAGSASEVNLRAGDIANMGFAEAADLPVVLVGDIERGGLIAALVGTHALLPAAERARLKGYIVNKFRGDPALFDDAVTVIAERTGLPCLGIVPFFQKAGALPAEDGMALAGPGKSKGSEGAIRIAVPVLPRIANFDDFDPLAAEPGVHLDFVKPGRPLPADAALVILPGSKATLSDLAAFRAEGWDIDLKAHLRRGGQVLGICGGYQMLGRVIADPDGFEGPAGSATGLGLLDVETVLGGRKTLTLTHGVETAVNLPVRGYEMHLGVTTGEAAARPMLILEDGRADGARSADGRVAGCYLHGIFSDDEFRRAFIAGLGGQALPEFAFEAEIEATLDALARHLEANLDMEALLGIASEAGTNVSGAGF